MYLFLILVGVLAVYAGALLLWLRLSPNRMWLWGPLALVTVGLALVLVSVAHI